MDNNLICKAIADLFDFLAITLPVKKSCTMRNGKCNGARRIAVKPLPPIVGCTILKREKR